MIILLEDGYEDEEMDDEHETDSSEQLFSLDFSIF